MKKSLSLLASLFLLITSVPVQAEEASSDKIEDIKRQISSLQAELKELEGDESDDNTEEQPVIADNEEVFIKYLGVKEKKDSSESPYYEFTFEIENRSDLTLAIIPENVSINNMMVDLDLIGMNQTITPGKTAHTVMQIKSYKEDLEIPVLAGNLDLNLKFLNENDYSEFANYPVSVDLEV